VHETPFFLVCFGAHDGAAVSRYDSIMDPLLASDQELARQVAPAEKLAQALEMMTAGIRLKRAALRRQFPQASATEIADKLATWLVQDD
jgi:hypothetical protein